MAACEAATDLPPRFWSIQNERILLDFGHQTRLWREEFSDEEVEVHGRADCFFALRQSETGTPVEEITRKLGVSQQTFYRWKRKFAGLGVPELRRLRQLEEENRKLKQLVADLSLDKRMLQDVLSKKV